MLADSAIPKVENERAFSTGLIRRFWHSDNWDQPISPELTEISHRVEAAIANSTRWKPWVVASDLAAGTKATRLDREGQNRHLKPRTTDHVLFLLGNKEKSSTDDAKTGIGDGGSG